MTDPAPPFLLLRLTGPQVSHLDLALAARERALGPGAEGYAEVRAVRALLAAGIAPGAVVRDEERGAR